MECRVPSRVARATSWAGRGPLPLTGCPLTGGAGRGCGYLIRAGPSAENAGGRPDGRAGEGNGAEAADQLRGARGDGRGDAGGDGAVPARGHPATGELRG